MKNTFYLRTAITLALGSTLIQSAQAAFPTGTLLSIDAGVPTINASSVTTDVATGSWFGMDNNGSSKINGTEKTPLSSGPDGGIIIGVTQDTNGHFSHGGTVHPGTGGVDAEWSFFGNAGMHLTTVPITSLSATTLDLSGWNVTWNRIGDPTNPVVTSRNPIPMTSGAWSAGYTNGVAILTCATDPTCGTSGDTYKLDYSATVPAGDISGFGLVKYFLHLEGTITNDAPTISVPSVQVTPGTSGNFTITAADANPSTGEANTSITCSNTNGSTGTVILTGCTSGTYTDNSGVAGTTDSFTVTVNDGLSTTTATVNVLICSPGLCPPIAANDTVTISANSPVVIDVTANDVDLDGTVDATTVIATDGTYGTTSVDPVTGVVTYTPAASFAGTDTFTYTVDDNEGNTSSPATVTVIGQTDRPASSEGTLSGGSYDTDNDGRTDSALPDDAAMDTTCLGGCFDFVITGVTGSVDVVLPLTEALPNDAGSLLVYRKYDPNTSAWRTFTPTEGNEIKSALGSGTDGTPAVCPTPGSSDNTGVSGYRTGLNPGDRCLQVTLVDNGEWDSNAVVGTVADPGGIGIYAAAAPSPVGTEGGGGCALSTRPLGIGTAGDWLLVGAALAGLGLLRRRVF